MANQEHVYRLKQGVEAWNKWRKENPEIKPDLTLAELRYVVLNRADLSDTNLSGASLGDTDLSSANLSFAKLHNTDLSNASLIEAKLYYAEFKLSNLSRTDLRKANLTRANLSRIDLRYTDLRGANLNRASLTNVNLGRVDLRNINFSSANLSEANLTSADLSNANLIDANLSKSNLYGANLSDAILLCADLSNANLNDAILHRAELSEANLKAAQVLNASLNSATLTGACIEDWNINSYTNLRGVICEYIFTGSDLKKYEFTSRRPHDPNQMFAPGEFTKRYQIVLESVDLFFNDGIDWKAFLASLQDLKTQYGEDLNIQGIEKKAGGSFVVRLEVPSDVNKGAIERTAKALYETKFQILEARYHSELQAKDKEIESYRRESANMMEIAKLLASKPITVEAKAVANQSSSESYTNNFNNSTIANFANKMQDQASQQTNQYIGTNLNEITTLIRSLRSKAELFPQEQRTEALEHLEEIETELKQPPEQRKKNRIKAALAMLAGIATVASGAVASTNEFVGQVQELSDKLGIPLPIEQVQSQSQQPDVNKTIDVNATKSDQP